MDEFITCPWCGQRNLADSLECRKCGGPLPVKAGAPLGAAPPPPPRALPKGYKKRMLWKDSPLTLIGSIFTALGAIMGCIFSIIALAAGVIFMLIGSFIGFLFLVIGGIALYTGIQQGLSKIRPYEMGHSAIGEITEIYQDTTITVNGRHPWAVLYRFEIGGIPYEGKARTWNYAPKLKSVGDKVYVLYLSESPDKNALYPPLG